MTFEEFRQQKMSTGEHTTNYDAWDPVRTPRKVIKPKFVKYEGRAYEVIEESKDELKLAPLHGKAHHRVVSTTSTRLKK